MSGESRDWKNIESPYGSAAAVPELLLRAKEAETAEEGYEAAMNAVSYVVLDGVSLTEAAPQMADELLRLLETRPRIAAPILRGLYELLRPAGNHRGDPRVIPAASAGVFSGSWEMQARWEARTKQAELEQRVRERVTACSELIVEYLRAERDEDYVVAAAVASLAELGKPEEWLLQATKLTSELAHVSVVASTAWRKRDGLELKKLLDVSSALAAPAQVLLHLLQDVSDRNSQEILAAWLRRGARTLSDLNELVWGSGSAAFLFAAALARSSRSDVKELLEKVVIEAENGEEDELDLSQWTGSASAAYWLMRRDLGRHWMRGVALGPEDLNAEEITTLRTLSRYDRWRRGGGESILEFGLFALRRDVGRLSGGVRDLLNTPHEGFFGPIWVRWSRWKWVMNGLATFYAHGSEEAILDDIANQIVSAARDEEREEVASAIREMREAGRDEKIQWDDPNA